VYHARTAVSGGKQITVYINNTKIMAKSFTGGNSYNNRIALAASGDACVDFDYVAAGPNIMSDIQSKYDGAIKGYISGMLETDRGQQAGRAMPSLAAVGFERFDDYVRGIYVDDIKFPRGPALTVNMVTTSLTVRDATNRAQVALGSDVAGAITNRTPHGATIAVANVSSKPLDLVNVTDQGDLLYPFVYGAVLNEFEQVRINKQDAGSVSRWGEKKLEFAPQWINNRTAAESIAQYVVDLQKDGLKQLNITAWSMTLVQLGDTIRVYAPEKNIDGNYVVTGATKSGDKGVQTQFKLVKV